MKKAVAKVKYRENRMRRDEYNSFLPQFDNKGAANLNIEPYMPIRDKKIILDLKELKTKILLAIHNATSTREVQKVIFGKSKFTIYPGVNEKLIKKFKTNEW